MSPKLTNQAGKGSISLFGCVVGQTHPSNCAAHAGRQALHQLPAALHSRRDELLLPGSLAHTSSHWHVSLGFFRTCYKESLLFLLMGRVFKGIM